MAVRTVWIWAFLLALVIVPTAAGKSIVDRSGQQVQVDKPFSRIISLYPAHTENLFALGLDAEIIGVSKNDDYPPGVLDKARFSYREDAEKFIAARPDLVLVRPMIERGYPDLIEKLRMAGIVVVSLQPVSIDETYDYWRTLGALTGRQQQAEKMIAEFKEKIAAIEKKVATIPPEKRKRVYFESIHRKMKTFAPTSMAVFALETAGGINVAADADRVRNTNIAAYSKERILSHAGEIDVFLAQRGKMNRVDRDEIVAEPGFSAIKAVRDGEVYIIAEELVSRPTPRLLEGIRQIGRILYPDYF